jgi:hypothetical protein
VRPRRMVRSSVAKYSDNPMTATIENKSAGEQTRLKLQVVRVATRSWNETERREKPPALRIGIAWHSGVVCNRINYLHGTDVVTFVRMISE